MSNWTLFSNHGHVLICLARDSEARLRDVAVDVGITERAVQKIVRDLQDGGMVSVTKNGRRNSYRIHNKKLLRHDLEANCTLGDLISIVNKKPGQGRIAVPEVKKSKPIGIQALAPSSNPAPRKFKAIKPEPEKPESKKPVPKKPEVEKSGSGKASVSDSKDRQQGSLF